MMAKLGQFLRRVLEQSDVPQVTLEQELQFTALYLEIEQIRFADRLTLDYQLDPQALPGLVPSLLLQPLVENAVRHGIALTTGGGTIRIQAEQRAGRLLLAVQDDGPGVPHPVGEARGVGLRNSEERLRTHYGATGYALSIHSAPARGFTVRLDLPFTTAL
jgi:LytS/YehU family sensor histidine kinase